MLPKLKLSVAIGTRPEAIKLLPVVGELRARSDVRILVPLRAAGEG